MLYNKHFPNFLRDLTFSFMPIYCRRRRHLYLIDEKLWNSIAHKITYRRSNRVVRIRFIKVINFVYGVNDSIWRSITPQHIMFLRNKHILVPTMKHIPFRNPYTICAIESCYFMSHFQRMDTEFFKHIKWRTFFRGRYVRRWVRLGFFREHYVRDDDFDDW